MKIWDLPKTKKETIKFCQDKGLLPTTKQCVTKSTQNDFVKYLIRHYIFIIFCFILLALSKLWAIY